MMKFFNDIFLSHFCNHESINVLIRCGFAFYGEMGISSPSHYMTLTGFPVLGGTY